MSADLYSTILGIPGGSGRPPHHYDLLGVKLFESDGNVIHSAGLRRVRTLREWQIQTDLEAQATVQGMMNQVSRACNTLEVAERKEDYDKQLARQLGVNLVMDKTYRILVSPPKMRKCSCGAMVSDASFLCTECGYVFSTGQRIANYLTEGQEGGAVGIIKHRQPSSQGDFLGALLRVYDVIVTKLFALIIVGCVLALAYFILASRNGFLKPTDFVVVESSSYEGKARMGLLKSEMGRNEQMAKFFTGMRSNGREGPFVNLEIEKLYGERGVGLHTYMLDISTLPDKKSLHRGRILLIPSEDTANAGKLKSVIDAAAAKALNELKSVHGRP